MPIHIADIIAVLFFAPLIILIADQAWDRLSHTRNTLEGARVRPRRVNDPARAGEIRDSRQSRIDVAFDRMGDRRRAA